MKRFFTPALMVGLMASAFALNMSHAHGETVSHALPNDADSSRPDTTASAFLGKDKVGSTSSQQIEAEALSSTEPAAGPDATLPAPANSGAVTPLSPAVPEALPAASAALTPPPSLTTSSEAGAPIGVTNPSVMPVPDQSQLKPAGANESSMPPAAGGAAMTPGGVNTATASQPAVGGPLTPSPAMKKGSDQYYDSNATLPSAQMPAPGPRKVDPSVEPGQKFVVVSGVRKASDRESIIASADRALKMGRYDAALELYNSAYAKSTRDKRVLMGRAVAQQRLGQTDQAIASYDQLLDVAPNDPDALVNMLGLVKQKDPNGALQRMLALQEKHPTHAGLAAQIGLAAGETGNYDVAMRNLGKASILDPQNPQHMYNMAVLADRQSKTSEAIKDYEQALQIDSMNKNAEQGIPHDKVNDRLAVLRGR